MWLHIAYVCTFGQKKVCNYKYQTKTEEKPHLNESHHMPTHIFNVQLQFLDSKHTPTQKSLSIDIDEIKP